MGRQLALDLPRRIALGADAYFVGEANADAYVQATAPETWPEGKLALVGPPGSGKTHLARLFADRTGALVLEAPALTPATEPPRAPAIVVENADRLPREAEETLFHIHNAARAARTPLLLTAATPPSRWPTLLPDLRSRMEAAPVARIGDPDDRLLTAVLVKLFDDRGLSPPPEAVRYLVTRMQRSFDEAARIADLLDRAALAEQARLTIPFIRRVLPPEDETA
ncbi:HdaA/DnaA family protein [Histidinibacterium aquaticum]|uniref:Chromosomal replication initiator DnaA n=1 Tax=Histidinibacterium aquaticum TaxID=2613962 RepID=A0A5J5GNN1_9RHOB|nr:DnaA/Hda family protein [Histidinibacterium aquaticum]KAA9009909.1 chromosomal replication initiator DnaA [Histidinibacterium aquaticum]